MALHKSMNTLIEFPVKPEADYEEEVAEWLEAFDQVVDEEGANKGAELIERSGPARPRRRASMFPSSSTRLT